MTQDGAPTQKHLTFLDRQQYTSEVFEIEELSPFNQEEALSSKRPKKSNGNSKKDPLSRREREFIFSRFERRRKKSRREIEI